MAISVGYFQNPSDEVYAEGPFVMVHAGGWRIEVHLEGHQCPILADPTVYRYVTEVFGMYGKTNNKKQMSTIIDHLNMMVKNGNIIKDNSMLSAGIGETPILELQFLAGVAGG